MTVSIEEVQDDLEVKSAVWVAMWQSSCVAGNVSEFLLCFLFSGHGANQSLRSLF